MPGSLPPATHCSNSSPPLSGLPSPVHTRYTQPSTNIPTVWSTLTCTYQVHTAINKHPNCLVYPHLYIPGIHSHQHKHPTVWSTLTCTYQVHTAINTNTPLSGLPSPAHTRYIQPSTQTPHCLVYPHLHIPGTYSHQHKHPTVWSTLTCTYQVHTAINTNTPLSGLPSPAHTRYIQPSTQTPHCLVYPHLHIPGTYSHQHKHPTVWSTLTCTYQVHTAINTNTPLSGLPSPAHTRYIQPSTQTPHCLVYPHLHIPGTYSHQHKHPTVWSTLTCTYQVHTAINTNTPLSGLPSPAHTRYIQPSTQTPHCLVYPHLHIPGTYSHQHKHPTVWSTLTCTYQVHTAINTNTPLSGLPSPAHTRYIQPSTQTPHCLVYPHLHIPGTYSHQHKHPTVWSTLTCTYQVYTAINTNTPLSGLPSPVHTRYIQPSTQIWSTLTCTVTRHIQPSTQTPHCLVYPHLHIPGTYSHQHKQTPAHTTYSHQHKHSTVWSTLTCTYQVHTHQHKHPTVWSTLTCTYTAINTHPTVWSTLTCTYHIQPSTQTLHCLIYPHLHIPGTYSHQHKHPTVWSTLTCTYQVYTAINTNTPLSGLPSPAHTRYIQPSTQTPHCLVYPHLHYQVHTHQHKHPTVWSTLTCTYIQPSTQTPHCLVYPHLHIPGTYSHQHKHPTVWSTLTCTYQVHTAINTNTPLSGLPSPAHTRYIQPSTQTPANHTTHYSTWFFLYSHST